MHLFEKSLKVAAKNPVLTGDTQWTTACFAAPDGPTSASVLTQFTKKRHASRGAITYLRVAGPIGSKSPVATGARGV